MSPSSMFLTELEQRIEQILRMKNPRPVDAVAMEFSLDVDSQWGDLIMGPAFAFGCETFMTEMDRKNGTVTYVFFRRPS